MTLRYAHIDTTPPKAAQEAARRALEALPADGASDVARSRLRDLSAGRRLAPAAVRRMKAYSDTVADGPADDAWGGDSGAAWARRVAAEMDKADRAAEMGAGPHTSVCVVVPIDAEVAEHVAIEGGLPASEMHVTLVFLGKADAYMPTDLDRLRTVVAEWARATPPLPARFSGTGRFAGDEGDAVYLSVDAVGLAAVREGLVRYLRDALFAVPSAHGFDPHATLAYLPTSAPNPSLPYTLPLAFSLDRAAVWIADDRSAEMPFTGTADPTTLDARETLHGEPVALLFADGAPPAIGHQTWNQIARVGEFLGHPQGPARFTREVLEQVVRNFAAVKNGEVPGDFEHTSERLPPSAASTGVPAPFWVTALEIRNGGSELWARFRWVSPDAVRMVRAEQYKYVSPAINFAARSRETGMPIGARLSSVALTNHPFIDGMQPITASSRDDAQSDATHLHSPSPDALHAPSLGHATHTTPRNPMPNEAATATTMDDKKPDATTDAGDADANAAKAAEAEKAATAAQDARTRFPRMMAECLRMTDAPVDAEALESALLDKIKGMVAELEANQKREVEAQMSAAKTMSARVVAAGLAAAGSEERLATLCFSQRETFDAIYPLTLLEEVEKKRAAAAAAKPKEGAALFAERPGASEAVAVLTQPVGAAGGKQPSTQTAVDNPTILLDARAVEIAKADPTLGYIAARAQAERELAEKTATR